MSTLNIALDIKQTLGPELLAKAAALNPRALADQLGAAGARLTKSHLLKLNQERPNALGGRRTNFYAQGARATTWSATDTGATVVVAAQGLAQRFHGGTINAKPGKALSIPADAEAHGRSPREFSDLRLVVFGATGRAALVTARSTAIRLGKRGVKAVSSTFERVLYWLVKSVTQRADPSVLPTAQEYSATATAHLSRYLSRLIARQRGAQ